MKNKLIKQILYIVLFAILLVVLGGIYYMLQEHSVSTSDISVSKVTIYYKNQPVDIKKHKDIKVLSEMFENCTLDKENELKKKKGWIYKLVFYDENDNEMARFTILNDNAIRYNGNIYVCDDISVSVLDELYRLEK